jgi:hypothetical protein
VVADGGASPAGVSSVLVTLNPGHPLVGHQVLLLQPPGGHATVQASTIPTATSGCSTASPAGTSDCNGQAAFTVSSSTAGAMAFTAFDQTDGVLLQQVAAVTFIPPPPTVSTISPSSGPITGGTTITINGSGFAPPPGATTVEVGGTPATDVSCTSSTRCTAVTPAHAAGPAQVVVTTASGPSTPAMVGAGVFTYLAGPVPVVSSVSPASGSTAGGNVLTINGSNLGTATGVRIGATTVSIRSRNSAGTQLTVTVPPGAAATVDVVVITPDGTSATGAGARYTYLTPTTTTTRCRGILCWFRFSSTPATTTPTTTAPTVTTVAPVVTTPTIPPTTTPTTARPCTGWFCWLFR